MKPETVNPKNFKVESILFDNDNLKRPILSSLLTIESVYKTELIKALKTEFQ